MMKLMGYLKKRQNGRLTLETSAAQTISQLPSLYKWMPMEKKSQAEPKVISILVLLKIYLKLENSFKKMPQPLQRYLEQIYTSESPILIWVLVLITNLAVNLKRKNVLTRLIFVRLHSKNRLINV